MIDPCVSILKVSNGVPKRLSASAERAERRMGRGEVKKKSKMQEKKEKGNETREKYWKMLERNE